MKRKAWPLIILNIIAAITICMLGFLGADVFRCAIVNKEDNGPVSMFVGLAIAFIAFIFGAILIVTTVQLTKGIFKKRLQIFAAAFLMFIICITDAIYHKEFSILPTAETASLIYLNTLAILEMIASVVTAAVWEK